MTGKKRKQEKTRFGLLPAALTPVDPDAAREDLDDVAAAAKEAELPRLERLLKEDGDLSAFFAAVFDLSPYLRDCARRRPEMLDALFDASLDERLASVIDDITALGRDGDLSEAAILSGLRRLKTEAHFLIGLGDLGG